MCDRMTNCSGHGTCLINTAPALGMETNSSCVCDSGFRRVEPKVQAVLQSGQTPPPPPPPQSPGFWLQSPVDGCEAVPTDLFLGLGQALFTVIVAGAPALCVVGAVSTCIARLVLREIDRMRLIRRGIVKYCREHDERTAEDDAANPRPYKVSSEMVYSITKAEVNGDLCVLLPPQTVVKEEQQKAVLLEENQPLQLSAIAAATTARAAAATAPPSQYTGPAGDPGGHVRARWTGAGQDIPAELMVPVALAASKTVARTDNQLAVQGDSHEVPAVPIPRLDSEAARAITNRLDWSGLGPGVIRESISRRLTVPCFTLLPAENLGQAFCFCMRQTMECVGGD
jgi:hypothetical protein